ncbi:MAG: alpha/beta hydrolase [Bacteroidales bacterium]|nr:alpha/beta hydrolase [Bacteroidales bacterium]
MIVLKIIGIILGILIGLIILYLIIVIFFPGFNVEKQPLQVSKPGAGKNNHKPPESRKEVSFKVNGTLINAWQYMPEDLSTPVPCIIMSNGFGGTKDMLLESYALRFVKAGMAVLAIDYRYFGDSEGEPRQLFFFSKQLEDCSAAIEYARGIKNINPDRIAMWGTSASGGYGIITAARDKRIACVCGQCPALDSHTDGKLAVKREGIWFFLRLFMHAQRDMGRSRFGLSAHKLPIVGKPGSLALINAPGAFDGYSKVVSASFVNEVCTRGMLRTHGFNPIDYAKDVQCPVLLQVCEKDNLVSLNSVLKTAKKLGKYAEVKKYPIGHFDIYTGDNFEKSVTDQITFFRKYL